MTLTAQFQNVLIDGALRPARLELDADGRVLDIAPGDASGTPSSSVAGLPDGGIITPRPLDLHLHGAHGHAVAPGGSEAALDASLAGTDWIATLPAPGTRPDEVGDAVRACANATRDLPGCVGIRLEGVFISPEARGVWPAHGLSLPDIDLADACIEAASEMLRIVDLAPDLPGACELARHLVSRGIVVAIAHTTASAAQTTAMIDAGATLATHLWNAMSPVHHRDGGVVATCLNDPRVTCELIGDGVHVEPAMVELTFRAARGDIALVSDASPFAGMPAGSYSWSGIDVAVDDDGVVRDGEGLGLAGGGLVLSDIPSRLRSLTNVDIASLLAAATSTPRRVLEPGRPNGLARGDHARCWNQWWTAIHA